MSEHTTDSDLPPAVPRVSVVDHEEEDERSSPDDRSDLVLTCPHCKEPLVDPRLLSCFHSVCARHIVGSDGKVSCPVCGIETAILGEPQPDELLARLLSAEAAANPVCANCETEEATLHCKTCQAALCGTCHGQTHAAKIFSRHEVVPIEDQDKPGISTCEQHNRPFELYCQKHSKLLCIGCFFDGAHKGHQADCIDLTSANELLRSQIDAQVKALCALRSDATNARNALEDATRQCQTNYKMITRTVAKLSESITEAIAATKKSILDSVRAQRDERMKEFDSNLRSLAELKPKLEVTFHELVVTKSTKVGIACAEEVLRVGSPFEFLALSQLITTRLKNIQAARPHNVLRHESGLLTCSVVTELRKAVEPVFGSFVDDSPKKDSSREDFLRALSMPRSLSDSIAGRSNLKNSPTQKPRRGRQRSKTVSFFDDVRTTFDPAKPPNLVNPPAKKQLSSPASPEPELSFDEYISQFSEFSRESGTKLDQIATDLNTFHVDLTRRKCLPDSTQAIRLRDTCKKLRSSIEKENDALTILSQSWEQSWVEMVNRITESRNKVDLRKRLFSSHLNKVTSLCNIVDHLDGFATRIVKVSRRCSWPDDEDLPIEDLRSDAMHASLSTISQLKVDTGQRLDAIRALEASDPQSEMENAIQNVKRRMRSASAAPAPAESQEEMKRSKSERMYDESFIRSLSEHSPVQQAGFARSHSLDNANFNRLTSDASQFDRLASEASCGRNSADMLAEASQT